MSKRAQVALTDLTFGLVIFLILLTSFFIEWTRLQNRLTDTITFSELEINALYIADLLAKTPGVPNDWETRPQSLDVLGLAAHDRTLSPTKVTAFANITYNQAQQLFNVERFGLYILLKKNNQAILELGTVPTKRAVHIRRIVRYNEEKATLDVALWQR